MAKVAYITIKNCHRIDQADVIVKTIQSNQVDSRHIICLASKTNLVSKYHHFVADLKATVQQYHQTVIGNKWKPLKGDDVYWITVDYPSWIHTIHWKCSNDAADQANSPYNYFQTQQQVDYLLSLIQQLFLKYGI